MDWLPLSLLCAFSVATADALTKRHLADYGGWELVLVRFGASSLILLPVLLLGPWPALPLAFWGWIAVLVPLELGAMWLYVRAIRDAPLSHTLPYLAFTPVFAALTGHWLLGEAVSQAGLIGIGLVVLGAYALNLEHLDHRAPATWLAPLRAIGRERGSRRMMAVALLYSLTAVMGKGAMAYASPRFFGPFYFTLLGLLAMLPSLIGRPARLASLLLRRPRAHLAVGLAMSVMVISHFYAISLVEVAYMLTVKRTSLLFGMVYGAWLFHERRLGANLLAGVLMVLGVAVIALVGG